MALKYKRVLLKISGEVLKGDLESGVDGEKLMAVARDLKALQDMGCEVGVVNGGGNIWRFRDNKDLTLDRTVSDQMGMLATVMNSMALEEALKQLGAPVKAVTKFPAPLAVEDYDPKRAREYMAEGRIVIFAGGTGNPYFTTDSAAALRALEMNCDVLLKATNVDYVYDKDPDKHDDAQKYEEMTYQEVIEQGLGVMDLTCASLCKEGDIPMLVFNLNSPGSIEKAVKGDKIGTVIHN
jgi:uridylate kinase